MAQHLLKVLGLQAIKVWFPAALDAHVAHEEISLETERKRPHEEIISGFFFFFGAGGAERSEKP